MACGGVPLPTYIIIRVGFLTFPTLIFHRAVTELHVQPIRHHKT